MKKNKKMFTMVGSLALVGAVAVGATLAYLSDNTSTITNTFTVGNNISVQISEKDIDGNPSDRVNVQDTADEQNYGQLTIGDDYDKDPRVDLLSASPDSYLYIYVSGVDTLKGLDLDNADNDVKPDFEVVHINDITKAEELYTFDSDWTKIADVDGSDPTQELLDGIYVYGTAENPTKMTAGNSTDSLFDKVRIADDVTSFKDGAATSLSNSKIVLKAAAVQADNNSAIDANNQAIGLLS